MPRRITLPCDALCVGYRAGQTTSALARRYACSPTTIAKRLRACGVQLRAARYASIPINPAALYRMYMVEHRTIAAIAAYFGVSASTIGNKRRRYGIPIRPRVAAVAVDESC